MSGEPQVVEFERHVAGPPPAAGAAAPAPAPGLGRSITLARAGTFVVAALLIAFLTHRVGMGLGGALCVFFGLLPVMWFGSWMAGFLAMVLGVRKLAREGKLQDVVAQAARPAQPAVPSLRRERLRLEQHPDALQIETGDGFDRQVMRWRWSELSVRRAPAGLVFSRGKLELHVPTEAFGMPERLEAFVAAAEARIGTSTR